MSDPLGPALPWLVPLLVALIPAAGGIVVGFVQREALLPRPYRRLGQLVNVLAKAPEGTKSREALDTLVVNMITPLSLAVSTARPKLNPYNVFWTVVFAILTGFAMFGLAQWVISANGTPWAAISWVVTIVVGLLLSAFVAAAISTVRNPVITRSDRDAKKATNTKP